MGRQFKKLTIPSHHGIFPGNKYIAPEALLSREVEGPALRNLGNLLNRKVPIPTDG
jgi:hypothetical protein